MPPKNFEDIPTRHPDNLGAQELGGFKVGQKVYISGYEGTFMVENLFPDTEHAKVKSLADHLEDDSIEVSVARLRSLEL